jgi:hypothetical protein
MSRPALPSPGSVAAPAMISPLTTCTQLVAAKEAALTRQQTALLRLAEQVQDLEVDLQDARLTIAYLSDRVAELLAERTAARHRSSLHPARPPGTFPLSRRVARPSTPG